jgi:predicted ABC-type ATPase
VTRILWIIRGLPGTGKSTQADRLVLELDGEVTTLEADMWFMRNGEYIFDASALGSAHKFCQLSAEYAMRSNEDHVIISNTFTTMKEMKPYLQLAKTYNYQVRVRKCIGEFKSIHNVPEETIAKMKDRWQDYDGEMVIPIEDTGKLPAVIQDWELGDPNMDG